jgi:hypothetical protein
MFKSNVTYPVEMRVRARAEGVPLLTLDFDQRTAKGGRLTIQTRVTDPAVSEAVENLIQLLTKKA